MPNPVVAVVGSTLASTAVQSRSASKAQDAQSAQNMAAQEEQRRQFDEVRKLLEPYVNAGTGALGAQQNLIGLGGADAQRQAIEALQGGPQFQAMQQAGQNAILQNASATGGLRGGNTQSALGQFDQQLLAQLIQQQYGNLGGLTSIGQNAAAGVGNAGMQTGNNISSLMGQQGAIQAGGQLARGQLIGNVLGLPGQLAMFNAGSGGNLFGGFGGMGGLGGTAQGSGVVSGGTGLTGRGPF